MTEEFPFLVTKLALYDDPMTFVSKRRLL